MIDTPRKFQGVWIPADTWLDRTLSITEKVMMVEIGSLETEARGCYASNAHFAEFFDLSISRVSEIINGLAAKGLVDIEQIREGKRIIERRIRMIDPFGKPDTPSGKAANPFGKGDEPPSENTKGSNTKTNNTNNNNLGVSVEAAFELFWKASLKNGSKKKAGSIFASICKRDKRDPMEFAVLLVNDTNTRIKAAQFGFDKLHGTTYLTQERWNDNVPVNDNAGQPSSKHHNLDSKPYGGEDDDAVQIGGL